MENKMYPRRNRRLFFFSWRFVPVLVALAVLFISTAAVLSYGSNKRGEEEEEEHAAVLRRFRNYLQINTAHPSPDYKSAVEFLLSQASEIGLDSRVLEFVEGKPLVLLTWKGEDPSISSILLNSHTDVVPAEREKWLHDPFAAVQAQTLLLSQYS
jgi:acetylornithine deacetylase/succinyl-diaminopimelate desuccinylase-like protein